MRRLAVALILACPAAALAQGPGAPDGARMDSIFASFTPGVPGCAVAAAGADSLRLEKAYGLADAERSVPFTPATVSEAGSVSKQFVAAAVLRLAERKKLSLDDDIRKYIPELPDLGTPITIRHLLSHTSGLRDWGALVALQGWPRGTRAFTNEQIVELIAAQRKLNFAPGTEWSYSNTGYNLSAVLVRRVTGLSLAEFTRREFFVPLGMTHTSWRDDHERIVPGRALAYEVRAGVLRTSMPNESAYGNGGLLTTVGDLLLWNEALSSGRVLGKPLVARMEEEGALNGGKPTGYGLGLFIGQWRGEREVQHSGATAGYRAFLVRYPDRAVSVAVLCNTGTADAPALGRAVAALLLPPVQATPPASVAAPPKPPVVLGRAALERLAGTYLDRGSMQAYKVTEAAGVLLLDGYPLEPVSASEFRNATGGDLHLLFQSAGATGATEAATGARPASNRTGTLQPAALAISGRDTVRLERLVDGRPSDTASAHLADYTGPWRSDELGVTWKVAVESGILVARLRSDYAIPLAPAYSDAFRSPDGSTWVFERDAGGKVSGLGVWSGRARDVRFVR